VDAGSVPLHAAAAPISRMDTIRIDGIFTFSFFQNPGDYIRGVMRSLLPQSPPPVGGPGDAKNAKRSYFYFKTFAPFAALR